MPYLGNVPAEAYSTVTKNTFSGDGSTTDFTMSLPSTTNNVRVVVENVIQDPSVAYTCTGTTLSFTSAPPAGTSNIYVIHLGPAVQTVVPPTEITNATTYTSDLTVQGALTASGDVTVSGDLTVDTNTLVVDSTNNRVGVGTASPDTLLEVSGASGNASIKLARSDAASTNDDFGSIVFENSVGTTLASIRGVSKSGNTEAGITFGAGGGDATRMTLDNAGNLLVGTNDLPANSGQGIGFRPTTLNRTVMQTTSDSTGSGVELIQLRNPNGQVGYVGTNATAAVYVTSSDYRLKENVTELTGAIDRVKQVPVHRFNFIADPDTTVDGFLAHEVQALVPEAVTGEKDAVDEDGNIEPQGIDQSKLVPLLTAALQEAIAKIEALEVSNADLLSRLEALENGA